MLLPFPRLRFTCSSNQLPSSSVHEFTSDLVFDKSFAAMPSPDPGAYPGPRPASSPGQPDYLPTIPPARDYNRLKPADVAGLPDDEHRFLPPHLKVYARLAKEKRLEEGSEENGTTHAANPTLHTSEKSLALTYPQSLSTGRTTVHTAVAPVARPVGLAVKNLRASLTDTRSSPSTGKTLSPAVQILTAPKPKRMDTYTHTAFNCLSDKEYAQHLESSPAQPSPIPNSPSEDQTAKTEKGKGVSFEATRSTWAWKIPAATTLSDSSGGSQYLSDAENDNVEDEDRKTKREKGKGKKVMTQDSLTLDETIAQTHQTLFPVQSNHQVQEGATGKQQTRSPQHSPDTSLAALVQVPSSVSTVSAGTASVGTASVGTASVGTAVGPHPRVASPDINYGAVDDGFLAPVAPPLLSPAIEPISGGGLSHSGDVDDDYLREGVVIGGGQVQEQDRAEEEEGLSDYMSLSDMSGTTIKSFDTSPTAVLKGGAFPTNLESKVAAYLEDLNKYRLVDWLVSADMDFGETPKPIVPVRRTNIDIAIDNAARRALACQGRSVRLEPGQTLGISENALKPIPLEPTSPNYFMRMKVLANFVFRCRDARHPAVPHPNLKDAPVQEGVQAPCVICAKANGFLMQPGHNRNFLESIMLPMSEITSYADMVTLLNMSVTQRAFSNIQLAARNPPGGSYLWECVRAKPMLDDYEAVLQQSRAKYRVLATGKIEIDENGIVRASEKAMK
ncbi:hypothetical protein F503_01328 [Ophiostoma piceae UAMH 11346]|uniref:Uncharacterized protein n=1 Tax=Ophiostoma piceae (strain UAMH 11346) TaxID=1262450 RepID=S3BSS9_OPHP1|nr:hypothetical protein F503_01328 [Ophiostoma piceae UAMH 11346]